MATYKVKKIPEQYIVDFVSKNFDYKRRRGKNGEELVICNPFDGSTKKKFNISLEKAVCHCWTGDEWAGPVNPKTGKRNTSFINFVSIYKKCSIKEAISIIFGNNHYKYVRISNSTSPQLPTTNEIKLPKNKRLSESNTRQAKICNNYLRSRGYTEETIKQNDIRYCGSEIIWPYYEYGEIVYWQSRSVLNKRFSFPDDKVVENDRVVAKLGVGKSDFLYGFDKVIPGTYVILVEAIFCQNTLGENALAMGGAVLSTVQAKKLRLLSPKAVVLAADNDKAGLKSILRNAEILRRLNLPISYCHVGNEYPDAKDWNDLFKISKLKLPEIRSYFESQIKPLSPINKIKLLTAINGFK